MLNAISLGQKICVEGLIVLEENPEGDQSRIGNMCEGTDDFN